MLEIGIQGYLEKTVRTEDTAIARKSGDLPVFATPAMIELMEETAWTSVAKELEAGYGTVGTALDIRHLAPTPVGHTLCCQSQLIQIDGRRLTFSLQVKDGEQLVGEGTHKRVLIHRVQFMERIQEDA